MKEPEQVICKLPDRTREIQEIVHHFSSDKDKLQKRIRQTLDFGDEGMSLSREFDCPSFYLEWVYKKLPPVSQKAFQQATLALLDSAVADPKNSMSPNSADELLLILHEVFGSDSEARPQILENLKKIIANDSTRSIVTQLTPENTVSLHMRALQMFVGFETKEPLSFWNQILKTYGTSYAGLVLGGVFNQDFDSGLQWLLDHRDSQEVLNAFMGSLPYYYESKFGAKRCDAAINTITPQVPERFARILRDEQERIKIWLVREAKNK